jgi:molybdate transport system substrate-binding protein
MDVKEKIFFFSLFFLMRAVSHAHSSPNEILIFAGAASKPATEEVIRTFQERTGVTARILFGGSGFVLSQMKLAKRGDLYFPGSSDFMEIAKKENLVYSESERIVAYLIPAINVQKGNPKGIHSLQDLTRNGIRLAIANPETVCVGTYAVEIIEKNLTPTEKKNFKRNLVNYTESCEKTANVISLKAVDAVMGWRVFQYWDPERIETVYLKPEEIVRIGYIPIAVSRFTKNRKVAEEFIDFLLSSEGKTIFKKYQYLMDPQEARRFATSSTPIGGEYKLPQDWKPTKRKEENP